MTRTIVLKGMRFFARHGVLPEERAKGQEFLVDVELELPPDHKLADDLDSTIDYAGVYAAVRQLMEGPSCNLVETLADRLASRLLRDYPVRRVRVAVKKPQVLLPGPLEWAGAEVTGERKPEDIRERELEAAGEREPAAEGVTAYLALGSNLGDRQTNLWQALGRLASHPQLRLKRVSSFYETRPVGNQQQGNFLNAVAEVETRLQPLELLSFLQEVEAGLGRQRDERWGPRTIDLDILLYGRERIALPQLIIPHPNLYERDFVIAPLAEIAPHLVHPDGRTSAEIWAEMQKFDTNLLSKFPGHVTI